MTKTGQKLDRKMISCVKNMKEKGTRQLGHKLVNFSLDSKVMNLKFRS